MAIYKIFPIQDATMYSLYPEKNTGLDSILETSLTIDESPSPLPQTSRFLTKFSSNQILDIINNKISGSQWDSNFKCFAANITSLNKDTTLELYAVSQPWDMGTGKYNYNPEVVNGVSWTWRDYSGSNLWIDAPLPSGVSASYSLSGPSGGGTWYVTQSLSGSQTFGYYTSKDININATKIVTAWYSGSIDNNGFIMKQKDEYLDSYSIQSNTQPITLTTDNTSTYPKLKFFSIDTHTIYPPCLEFKWNDCIINTGSSGLSTINSKPFVVSIGNNSGIFYPENVVNFRVNARPEFPTRTFSTSSYYTQNYYLPENSCYAIKDMNTNDYVIDFDSIYTKLSMDTQGSHFTLYMDGLEPERYYKILIKTVLNGYDTIIDNNLNFKVING